MTRKSITYRNSFTRIAYLWWITQHLFAMSFTGISNVYWTAVLRHKTSYYRFSEIAIAFLMTRDICASNDLNIFVNNFYLLSVCIFQSNRAEYLCRSFKRISRFCCLTFCYATMCHISSVILINEYMLWHDFPISFLRYLSVSLKEE